MIWNELIIHTNTNGVESLTDTLIALGIDCFVIEDPEDFKALLNDKTVPWDYIDDSLFGRTSGESRIKIYLSYSNQDSEKIKAVQDKLEELKKGTNEFGTLELVMRRVNDDDWADNWKKYFHPLEIGERIVIRPSWEEYENKDKVVVELDPSSSFGTGQHETTKLCLELLEKYMKDMEAPKLLDMGCGSGILGIAGVLLGAESVVAVDIDENAARIAKENAEKNRVSSKFTAYCGDVLASKYLRVKVGAYKYNIVMANIVADVLVAMSELFSELTAKDSIIICSGIIGSKIDMVKIEFQAKGFVLVESSLQNDWAALVFKK